MFAQIKASHFGRGGTEGDGEGFSAKNTLFCPLSLALLDSSPKVRASDSREHFQYK